MPTSIGSILKALCKGAALTDREHPDVLSTAVRVWYAVGRERLGAKEYEAARQAFVATSRPPNP